VSLIIIFSCPPLFVHLSILSQIRMNFDQLVKKYSPLRVFNESELVSVMKKDADILVHVNGNVELNFGSSIYPQSTASIRLVKTETVYTVVYFKFVKKESDDMTEDQLMSLLNIHPGYVTESKYTTFDISECLGGEYKEYDSKKFLYRDNVSDISVGNVAIKKTTKCLFECTPGNI